MTITAHTKQDQIAIQQEFDRLKEQNCYDSDIQLRFYTNFIGEGVGIRFYNEVTTLDEIYPLSVVNSPFLLNHQIKDSFISFLKQERVYWKNQVTSFKEAKKQSMEEMVKRIIRESLSLNIDYAAISGHELELRIDGVGFSSQHLSD